MALMFRSVRHHEKCMRQSASTAQARVASQQVSFRHGAQSPGLAFHRPQVPGARSPQAWLTQASSGARATVPG